MPLELLGADSLLAISKSFNGLSFLFGGEEFRFHDRWGHEPPHECTIHNREQTGAKGQSLPACDGTVRVFFHPSHTAIRDQSTDNGGYTVATSPEAQSPAVFVLLIPCRRDQEKSTTDNGFKHSQEKALGHETGKGICRCHASEYSTPDHHAERSVLGGRKHLQ